MFYILRFGCYHLVMIMTLGIFGQGDAFAHEPDTNRVREIKKLKQEMMDLKALSQALDQRLKSLEDDSLETRDVWQEMGVLEDPRSRRKWIDTLLDDLRQKSGLIHFHGNATTVLQGQMAHFDDVSAVGSFDLFMHVNLGERVLLFADAEVVGGNGPQANFETLGALNADAGSTQDLAHFDRPHILEAWGEVNFADEQIRVVAGKIDLTNYFDLNAVANDETSQFISEMFVNSLALPVPGNTPGFRAQMRLGRKFAFQVAAVSNDPSGTDIFNQLFYISGINFSLPIYGQQGTYRFYAYVQEAANRAKGYGFSVDQSLHKDITIFMRWNQNDSILSTFGGVRSAWSGGGQYQKKMWQKAWTVGAALGWAHPKGQGLTKTTLNELYLMCQLNTWTKLSTHLQYVKNTVNDTKKTMALLGVRTQFDF